MLIINMSSVAVHLARWQRGGAGQIEVGTLVAYLSYLIQILFACGDGHVHGVHDFPGRLCRRLLCRRSARDSVDLFASRRTPCYLLRASGGTLEFRDVGFALPGRGSAGAVRYLSFRIEGGHHDGHHRQYRSRARRRS